MPGTAPTFGARNLGLAIAEQAAALELRDGGIHAALLIVTPRGDTFVP